MSMPVIKLRQTVQFPGSVEATNGISVEKVNGVWTFATDWTQFGTLPTAPTSLTSYVLTYDTVTDAYVLVPSRAVDASDKVAKAGDTMTAALTISMATATVGLTVAETTGTHPVFVHLTNNGVFRIGMEGSAGGALAAGTTAYYGVITMPGSYGMHLCTNNVSRFVIDPIGQIIMRMSGTTPSVAQAVSALNIGVSGPETTGIAIRPTADGSYPMVFLNAADATVGYIHTTASTGGVSWPSDGTLKEDIKALKAEDIANIVDDTHVVDFKWKNSEERAFGVIAQEAKDVYPAAFSQKDERWFVNYSKYVPVLLQELKALRARVAELETASISKPARARK